jgi:hypothetical protein
MVNERLSSSLDVEWAAAPMSWDGNGMASRKLFLLSPAASGNVPAELETMKKRLISREEAAQAVLDSQKEAEEALAKAEAKK